MERPFEHMRTGLVMAAFVMFALLATTGSALALSSGPPRIECAVGMRPFSDLRFSPESCAHQVMSMRPFMDLGPTVPAAAETASRKPLSDLNWRPSGPEPVLVEPAPVPVSPPVDRFGEGLRIGLIVGLSVAILAAIVMSRPRRVRAGVPA